jgi:hypothetical protein
MGRHQNQAAKRARERNKKLKAEDKRAKRRKQKDLLQNAAPPRDEASPNGASADGAAEK